MSNYYDMDGNRIEVEQWSALFSDERRFIARTVVNDPAGRTVKVSTIWIGVAWALEEREGGKPLIYETMIFPHEPSEDEDEFEDLGCWRWATREEALAGHDEVVRGIVAR